MVFWKARLALFCDGDFWHGRGLAERVKRLSRGHNADYWVAKITSNVARDRLVDAELLQSGWLVVRLWESDVLKNPGRTAEHVAIALSERLSNRGIEAER
jgi:DNA mismatch endonuclease (patch repair protein)